MAKKNNKKEGNYDLGSITYVLGLISIVSALFSPLGGIVFGIIGLVKSKKQKELKKARMLNMTGIIINAVILIAYFAIIVLIGPQTLNLSQGQFPAS